MSILRDFEKRLEGVVEGFFARAFRSGLQPIELAKAVQRYAGNYQQMGLGGPIIPNVYRFVIAEEDLERFGGYVTPLQRELAEVIQRTADERGWQLKGPVRIEFQQGDDVRIGTYELRGKIEAPEVRQASAWSDGQAAATASAASGSAPSGSTQLMSPVASPGSAALTPLNGHGQPTTLNEKVVLGRLPDCDVTLDDPSVSRRHAEITGHGGRWTVADLGSTNGVKLNGERVHTANLSDGDQLELGNVKLSFSLKG